jgi:hypothetical protein
MQTSMIILQKRRLDPTNGADQVVKANGGADIKGARDVMQAERSSATRFVSSRPAKQ